MTRIVSLLFLGVAATALAGCGTLAIDYVPPASELQSTVRVTASYQTINAKVLVHGADVCDFNQAKVAAILTDWNSAFVSKKEAKFQVPANQEIAVSMPMTVLQSAKLEGTQTAIKSVVTQQVVRLKPEPSAAYEIAFSERSVAVYKLASSEAGAARSSAVDTRLDRSCKFSTKNVGNDRAAFYLVPHDNK